LNTSSLEFPLELFIELKGNPDLEGRLTITKTNRGFHVGVDLIFSESKKIFRSLGFVTGIEELEEARDRGFQELTMALNKLNMMSK
jgi:hypothetical protein